MSPAVAQVGAQFVEVPAANTACCRGVTCSAASRTLEQSLLMHTHPGTGAADLTDPAERQCSTEVCLEAVNASYNTQAGLAIERLAVVLQLLLEKAGAYFVLALMHSRDHSVIRGWQLMFCSAAMLGSMMQKALPVSFPLRAA